MQFNAAIVGKIAVASNGLVTYNGEIVSLQQLRLHLAALKLKNGVVWYYREAPEQKTPTVSTEVVQIVIDNKLPISFSTKPDYSTVALPDGKVKPRV